MGTDFDTCLLCGSGNLSAMSRYASAHLVKCRNCSFVFCKKKPIARELTEHYDTYGRIDTVSSITVKRYGQLLDTFEKYRLTNNILDIGSGEGHFLSTAKLRGWNIFGTEFSDRAITLCKEKGAIMHKGKLYQGAFPERKFDVITAFEVIEHINNPLEEIAIIGKLLRSGGSFYFTTPNFNSVSRFLFKEKWNVIQYPEHLSYYTPSTADQLLVRSGFKKISLNTTGFSVSRMKKALSNSDSWSLSSDEKLRSKSESDLFYRLMKRMINFLLNFFRAGDNLKGLYRKKA